MYIPTKFVPVAQWIEHWIPAPEIVGSSPTGHASYILFLCPALESRKDISKPKNAPIITLNVISG